MKNIFLTTLTIFIILFTSCETDVKLNAPWKDTTIVYGLLNQNDSVHYIKINKAFLGDDNLLNYAAIEDSNEYLYKLNVKLIEKDEADNIIRTFPLDTTSIYNKDTGLFYNPHQIVYTTGANNKVFLNDNYHYHLDIQNPKLDNKEITSQTVIVKDFRITRPLKKPQGITFFDSDDYTQKFEWNKAENGMIYYPYITIYIKEVHENNPDTINRVLKWKPFKQHFGYQNQNDHKENFKHIEFYQFIDKNITYKNAEEEDKVIERYADKMVFNVAVGSEELYNYIMIHKPSNSIVEVNSDYSNINNGIGLFGSRYLKTKPFFFHLHTHQRLAEKGNKFVMPSIEP